MLTSRRLAQLTLFGVLAAIYAPTWPDSRAALASSQDLRPCAGIGHE